MTYEAIYRFAIDGAIVDEAGLIAPLMRAGWDYETTVTAKAHFARYRERCAEAERLTMAAREFVDAFEAEYSGQFADERARRKAFAARVFGPDGTDQTRALSKYLFLAFDGLETKLQALLLRRVVMTG